MLLQNWYWYWANLMCLLVFLIIKTSTYQLCVLHTEEIEHSNPGAVKTFPEDHQSHKYTSCHLGTVTFESFLYVCLFHYISEIFGMLVALDGSHKITEVIRVLP